MVEKIKEHESIFAVIGIILFSIVFAFLLKFIFM